jgi:two-component SAPR family response regulator
MERYVICVDDEKTVLTSLYSQLETMIARRVLIECFTSPKEALEFLSDLFTDGIEPDLIICDWLMPEMKGDEFFINASKIFPDVQFVMLSGYARDVAVQSCSQTLKRFKFIYKPWSREDIESVLINVGIHK